MSFGNTGVRIWNISQTGSATRAAESEDLCFPRSRYVVFLTFVITSVAVRGSTSPQKSRLLAFVPEGAQIVAGIEAPHNPASTGRLLLVTRSSDLDLSDWIALTGV
jgi:hypothetical protein